MISSTVFPSGTDYAEALQFPSLTCRLPELQAAKVWQDALGMPMSVSGQSAIVVKFDTATATKALRCFTANPASARDRYRALASHRRDHGLDCE